MIELTQDLGSGYWLDVHFIRGKTRRLFYTPMYGTSGEDVLDSFLTTGGWGVVLHTEDGRPVWVQKKSLAAIEVVEAVGPEASGDDTESTETAT